MRKLFSISVIVLLTFLFAINGCQCKKSFSTNPLGIQMEFEDGSEILYKGDVSKSDAEELGEFLKEVGYIGEEDNPVSVQLLGEDGIIKIRFVVEDRVFNDEKTLQNWDYATNDLQNRLYKGKRIEVHLCDPDFNTKKVIHPGEGESGPDTQKGGYGKRGPT